MSIPYFDKPRADTTTAPLTTQTPGAAFRLSPGPPTEQWRFFGSLLDFNQTTPRFPTQVPPGTPNGPWPGVAVSLRDLVRGQHQCLVAELSYPPDPIAPGATAESSENLAQRNLAISEAANPGSPATRTVHHTFEVRQTRGRAQCAGDERGDQEGPWGRPDELMIRWERLPAGSRATLYMSAADTAEVVAQLRPEGSGVTPVDTHTLALDTTQVAFVPLPRSTRTVPALLTIELPPVVRVGERYGAVVHQVAGPTRAVVGTFELSIPVTKSSALVDRERRTLEILRSVKDAIAAASAGDGADPWEEVFARYVAQTEARVRGFADDTGGRRGCAITLIALAVLVVAILLWLLLG